MYDEDRAKLGRQTYDGYIYNSTFPIDVPDRGDQRPSKEELKAAALDWASQESSREAYYYSVFLGKLPRTTRGSSNGTIKIKQYKYM